MRAVNGEQGIIQQSYVYLPAIPGGRDVQKSLDGVDYFSTNLEFGVVHPSDPGANLKTEGVIRVYPVGELSKIETNLLQVAIPELKRNIERGVIFTAERGQTVT